MATQRVIHRDEDPDPTPVTPNICDPFSAQLGAQVTFTGVNGNQTITAVSGSIWPFHHRLTHAGPQPRHHQHQEYRPASWTDLLLRRQSSLRKPYSKKRDYHQLGEFRRQIKTKTKRGAHMATHRIIHHEEDTPNPVSPSICESFDAQLGAEVTFTGVSGTQTITQVGNTWPFTVASPMTVPNPATIYIKSSGLNVGQTYPYNVSQACPQGIQKGVTIIN